MAAQPLARLDATPELETKLSTYAALERLAG
jgi:hypothetical protein